MLHLYVQGRFQYDILLSVALIGEEFLELTSSQLTHHGLCELNRVVKEGDFCVFFRNNHFNTILKRKVR